MCLPKASSGHACTSGKAFSLDLSQCIFVGDKCSDLEAAHKAGVSGVLVMSSVYSEAALEARDNGQFPIAHVASTFVDAVDWIEQELLGRP